MELLRFVFGIVAVLLLASLAGAAPQPQRPDRPPARIISLIPAVTEMLFAIGAGPQVVAVSSFDRYPKEVEALPKVGALVDPDLERVLSLRPDLVATYGSQQDLQAQLRRAGVALYTYRHGGLDGVTRTIRDLGALTGRVAQAGQLAARIERDIEGIRTRVAGGARPRTLIVLGRESGALRGIYASGGIGFVHDMVAAAGGDNVFADVARENVQATTEVILAKRPEVILELRAVPLSQDTIARETAIWSSLGSVPAVRNRRVILLVDERTVIPGPRVAEGVEAIARALGR